MVELELWQLRQRQSLPLDIKINLSINKLEIGKVLDYVKVDYGKEAGEKNGK